MVRVWLIVLALIAFDASRCFADDAAIDALIDKLASDEPAEREAAYRELDAKGPDAESRLRARRNHPDAEARVRIEKLLAQRALDPLRKTRLVRERTVLVTGGMVNCAAWSPDGKLLATGGRFGDIVLWDTRTWKPVQRIDGGDSNSVSEIAFAPDGKRLWSQSGNLTIWEVNDTLTRRHQFDPKGGRDLTLSPDGHWAAWDEGHVKLVVADARSLEIESSFVVTDIDSRISSIAFPPDGSSVAVGTRDGKLSTWTIKSGKKASEEVIFTGGFSDVLILKWLADGTRVILGEEGKVRWGEISATLPALANGFVVSPDGKRFAYGDGEGNLKIATTTLDTVATWTASGDRQFPLAWSPDGSTVAATGPEGLRIWKNGKSEDYRAHRNLPRFVAFSGDSRFLALSDGRHTVFTNLETGATRDLALKASLGTGASGTDVLVLTADKAALWNADTGEERTVLRTGLKETARPFAFLSPDGNSLLWCSGREPIAILPVGKGPAREIAETVYPFSPGALQWSPDSKFAVVGGIFVDAGIETEGFSVWTADGHVVRHLRLEEPPDSLEWSPDGRFIWWSDEEGLNRLDVQSGQTDVMLGRPARDWRFLDDSLAVCRGEADEKELWHVPTMSKLCAWPDEINTGPGVLSPDRKRIAIKCAAEVRVFSFQR